MDRIDRHSSNGVAARLRMSVATPVRPAAHTGASVAAADRTSAPELTGVGLAGAEAPIDEARVGRIKAAIAQGQYLIEPHKTADAMIAVGFMLRNDR